MPQSVPTSAEFDALAARVAVLEKTPTPTPPPSGGGVQARRIADFLETGGSNFFPNGQDGSGAAGANNAVAYLQMIDYLTANTGMGFLGRVYDNGSDQTVIPRQVSALRPAVKWSSCYAQGSTIASVLAANAKLLAAGCLAFGEGPNEPGNTLAAGGTQLAPAAALAVQQAIDKDLYAKGVPVADASLNDTGSDSYPRDYWGTFAAFDQTACDLFNGHHYPNSGAPSRDFWRRAGLFSAEGWPAPGVITEAHMTLYNNHTKDEATGAYYLACAWLAGFKYFNLKAFNYFSSYEYTKPDGSPVFAVPVGLFEGHDPGAPRMPAKVIHNFFAAMADSGPYRRTFQPPSRNVTISGLPPAWAGNQGAVKSGGGQSMYFAGSDGREHILVWNEQDDLNLGHTDTVTVNLGSPVAHVTDSSLTNPITDNPTPIQTLANVSSVTMRLTTEVRRLTLSA